MIPQTLVALVSGPWDVLSWFDVASFEAAFVSACLWCGMSAAEYCQTSNTWATEMSEVDRSVLIVNQKYSNFIIPFFPRPSNHESQNLSSGDLVSTSSCIEYQASLLLCIPGNQIIVIELMSTHAQFFTSSTTKKWEQALKPMCLTHEVISPV